MCLYNSFPNLQLHINVFSMFSFSSQTTVPETKLHIVWEVPALLSSCHLTHRVDSLRSDGNDLRNLSSSKCWAAKKLLPPVDQLEHVLEVFLKVQEFNRTSWTQMRHLGWDSLTLTISSLRSVWMGDRNWAPPASTYCNKQETSTNFKMVNSFIRSTHWNNC